MRRWTVLVVMAMQIGCESNPGVKPHFVCPKCAEPTLAITLSMELGADGDWDERSLQIIECQAEGSEGLATYKENRGGGGETVRHQGKWVDSNQMKKIRESLNQCPSPQDSKCDCPAHLAARNINVGTMPGSFFEMKLIPR